ncbi:Transcription factor iws1 [Coemansia erecta]|uniref:Transcription factor iws1 n=1 Tax=Coemansia erecta TaxID=147472 RepID=A0A9W8CRX3_9FUNG|nr:Transcription factor iws1 [Coemansia erecta]
MSSQSPRSPPKDLFENEHENASVEARAVEVEDDDAAEPNAELDDLFGSEGGSDIDDNAKEGSDSIVDGEPAQDSAQDDDGGYPNIMAMPKIPKRVRLGEPKTSTTKQRSRSARGSDVDEDEDDAAAEESEQPVDPKQAEIDEMERQIKAAIKSGRSRRRKRTDEDDASIDEMIVELRKRMREAAYRDIDDNKEHLPAIHKLSMLQDVVDELGKTQLYEAFLDNNIVESIRLWLEPLDDGSLPSLDIQNAMLGALKKLPIRRDHLRESGIGKIVLFMSKCPRIPERNRRLCEQFVQQWSRMVMRLSSDFRDRKIRETTVDLTHAYKHGPRQPAEVAASKRRVPGGIRVESGSGRGGERSTARIPQRVAADYTVMPVSSISLAPSQPSPSRTANDRFKKLRQTMNRSGR